MKKILFLASISIATLLKSQTYPVGHISVNFKDASRSGGYTISGSSAITLTGAGRTIGTEVYYPATTNGDNTAIATSGQFPIVVFGHGFAMVWSSYDNIYNRLASLGYIVLLPRTEGGTIFPPPSHADFGTDLNFLAKQATTFNTVNTFTAMAMFNGRVLQTSAIGGHSMGAGASYLAAANNNSVTCLFNFAAATTNNSPNSIAQASLVTIPTLVVSGQNDNVADSTVQNSHFINVASAKKFHVIIKNLTHCDVGNGTDALCTVGQAACNTPSCNSIYFQRYMTYLEPFLANQLKNDCIEGQRFMDSITAVSSNRVGRKIVGTIGCASTALSNVLQQNLLKVYPNPTSNIITIETTNLIESPANIELYSITGELIIKQIINEATSKISIETLKSGLYYLVIYQNNTKSVFKINNQ